MLKSPSRWYIIEASTRPEEERVTAYLINWKERQLITDVAAAWASEHLKSPQQRVNYFHRSQEVRAEYQSYGLDLTDHFVLFSALGGLQEIAVEFETIGPALVDCYELPLSPAAAMELMFQASLAEHAALLLAQLPEAAYNDGIEWHEENYRSLNWEHFRIQTRTNLRFYRLSTEWLEPIVSQIMTQGRTFDPLEVFSKLAVAIQLLADINWRGGAEVAPELVSAVAQMAIWVSLVSLVLSADHVIQTALTGDASIS